MRFILILIVPLLLAACVLSDPEIDPKASCGAACNSNIECNSSIFARCKVCSFGSCSLTSPLDPPTVDAGVDATPDAR